MGPGPTLRTGATLTPARTALTSSALTSSALTYSVLVGRGLSATAGGTLLDERGRGADITGGSDGVGVNAVLSWGATLADSGGRDVHFGGALAIAGGRDVGFGGGLRREGRDRLGFGNTLAVAGGRVVVGFGNTLAVAGGRVVVGGGVVGFDTRPTMLDFGAVLAGAIVETAAVSGTLADSGMSSHPASTSSAGLVAS